MPRRIVHLLVLFALLAGALPPAAPWLAQDGAVQGRLADAPTPARETGARSGPFPSGGYIAVVRFVFVATFTYDASCPRRQARVDRLTRGVTSGGGLGAYDESYAYNAIGNMTSKAGVRYTYDDAAHKHAVTAVGDNSYTYDANGNMLTRPGQTLAWDAENRLASVTQGGVATSFTYNGDGQRVKVTVGNVITAYVGNLYEVNPSSGLTTTYYYLGSQRVAMRTAAGVTYLAGDHLGSASLAMGASNTSQRYYPYGGTRSGGVPTDYQFTGQKNDTGTGLYYYGGRYYDPVTGRFLSPDTLVQTGGARPTAVAPLAVSLTTAGAAGARPSRTSSVTDPQFLNRYTYTRNNPLAYVDATGNIAWWIVGGVVGAIGGLGAYYVSHQDNFNWQEAALWTGGGAVVGATFGAGAEWVAGAMGAHAVAGAGTASTAACADGDCTNEARAAAQITQGGLSAFAQAAEFGVKTYAELTKATAGTGLTVHHIVEQRFTSAWGLMSSKMPSIVLTAEEHQRFTNAWRSAIGYLGDLNQVTTANATKDQVWAAAQWVYAEHPELLEVVYQTIYGK